MHNYKKRKNIEIDVGVKSSVPEGIKQDTSVAEEKETSKVEVKKEAVQAKKITEKTTVKKKDNLK